MLKLLILSYFAALVLCAKSGKNDKSSEIYDTESQQTKDIETDTSEEKSCPLTESEDEKTKEIIKRKTTLKKIRSSKFPLQFKTKGEIKDLQERQGVQEIDKKIYKDQGFRKDKLQKEFLKQKRRDTTTNPKKKKKVTLKIKKKKYPTNIFENVSDLNFPTDFFTVDPKNPSTIDLDKVEKQLDRSEANQIMNHFKDQYKHCRNKKNITSSMDLESDIADRSVNSLFKSTKEKDSVSKKDDDDDEEKDDEDKLSASVLDRVDIDKLVGNDENTQRIKKVFELLNKTKGIEEVPDDDNHAANQHKIMKDILKKEIANDVNFKHMVNEQYPDMSLGDILPDHVKNTSTKFNKTLKNPLDSIEKAYKRKVKEMKKMKNTTEQFIQISKEYRKVTYETDRFKKDKKKEKSDKRDERRDRKPSDSRERPRKRYDSRERRYGDAGGYRGGGGGYRGGGYGFRGRGRYGSRERGPAPYNSRERYRPRHYDRGGYSRERYNRGGRYDSRYNRDRYRDRDSRYRPRDSRERYNKRSRERFTRKRFYSEENPPRRVMPSDDKRPAPPWRKDLDKKEGRYDKDKKEAPGGRREDRERRTRRSLAENSFERDYASIATNDYKNPVFRKFMKERGMTGLVSMDED